MLTLSSFQMSDPFDTWVDSEGWTHEYRHSAVGFPLLLVKLMEDLGYDEYPEFCGKEIVTEESYKCEMYLHIPAKITEPRWEPKTFFLTGVEFFDTRESIALKAITEFCKEHRSEVNSGIAKLFPFRTQADREWSSYLKAITSEDITLAASAMYMQAIYNLSREQEFEFSVRTQIMEEYKEKEKKWQADQARNENQTFSIDPNAETMLHSQTIAIHSLVHELAEAHHHIDYQQQEAERIHQEMNNTIEQLNHERLILLDENLGLIGALDEIQEVMEFEEPEIQIEPNPLEPPVEELPDEVGISEMDFTLQTISPPMPSESNAENSVNQYIPEPPYNEGTSRVLVQVDQDQLNTTMDRLGITRQDLGIFNIFDW